MDGAPPPAPRLTAAFPEGLPPPSPVPRRLSGAALGVALLLLVAVTGYAAYQLWMLGTADPFAGGVSTTRAPGTAGGRAMPRDLPAVAPVEYLPVAPDDARQINAAVPFSTLPNPAASPFHLTLPAADQARATDCLAAAVWYEAGDDAVGEEAVAQVVLNRLRHPAFPKTVCGVVFQGSERRTGCQFSFTCDGALSRTPSAVAWARARGIAATALAGVVFSPVGWATHYHTDWVVPNWSSSVDKVAAVHTHLFFRWRGGAGRPRAFNGRHAGAEPAIAGIARLSSAHADALAVDEAGTATALENGSATAVAPVDPPPAPPPPASALRGNDLARSDASGLFVIQIAPDAAAGSLALMALDLCRARAGRPCTVVGFNGLPGTVLSDGTRTRWPDKRPDFFFFADRSRGRETVLWNCARFPRPKPQCLPPDFVAAG